MTATSMMVPAMGAPTLPSTTRSARSLTAFLPTACSAARSITYGAGGSVGGGWFSWGGYKG